jgi:prophage DNA circulation protein
LSWRERLKRASYRGVEFEVDRAECEFGRRLVEHEYPFRPVAVLEDLGRKPRKFRFYAFLVGDDHDLAANRLQDLLEDGKGGDLVHPWMGRHQVQPLGECRRIEAASALRMTVFDLAFQEVDDRLPGPTTTPTRDLEAASLECRAQVAADVTEGVVTDGVPQFVRDGATAGASAVAAALSAVHFTQDATLDVSIFAQRVNALLSLATSAALSPATLVEAVLSACDSIRATAGTSIDEFYAYQSLFDLAAPTKGGQSPLAKTADQNSRLVVSAGQVGALYGAAIAAPVAQWPNEQSFYEASQSVLDALDAAQAAAGDALFLSLQRLRAAFGAAIDDARQNVRTSQTFTLSRATPALLLAYRFFDDVEREAEVLAAGAAHDPLAFPAGVPVTVLVDG